MENIFILIPAYNPDYRLKQLVDELKLYAQNIIIVNDGSNNGFDFECLPVRVISHSVNLGKGAALKSGFKYIMDNFPNCIGVVTADCDLQHLPNDIIKIFENISSNPNKLILGIRNFKKTKTPLKSIIGNSLIAFLMKLVYKIDLHDTQTGLRGIPASFIKHILDIKSSDFSFETTMLLLAEKLKIKIDEIEIETIYVDNNSGTHFRPLNDSYKIFKAFIKGVK